MIRPNVQAYLQSWGSELRARKDRVRNLIGAAHWPSDGHHKEVILREFLSRYLPADAECAGGFIKSSGTEPTCSPEVDVLVFNRRIHVPYFAEGDLRIVDASCVLANIEVKSTFSTATLKNALANIAAVRRLVARAGDARNLWSGIVFFELEGNHPASEIARIITSEIQAAHASIGLIQALNTSLAPTCISLGDSTIAFVSIVTGIAKVQVFKGTDLSLGCIVSDLFSSITAQVGGLNNTGLEEWVVSLPLEKANHSVALEELQ